MALWICMVLIPDECLVDDAREHAPAFAAAEAVDERDARDVRLRDHAAHAVVALRRDDLVVAHVAADAGKRVRVRGVLLVHAEVRRRQHERRRHADVDRPRAFLAGLREAVPRAREEGFRHAFRRTPAATRVNGAFRPGARSRTPCALCSAAMLRLLAGSTRTWRIARHGCREQAVDGLDEQLEPAVRAQRVMDRTAHRFLLFERHLGARVLEVADLAIAGRAARGVRVERVCLAAARGPGLVDLAHAFAIERAHHLAEAELARRGHAVVLGPGAGQPALHASRSPRAAASAPRSAIAAPSRALISFSSPAAAPAAISGK